MGTVDSAAQKKGPLGPFFNNGGEGGIDSSGAAFATLSPAGRSACRLRVQTLSVTEFVEPEGSSTPPIQHHKKRDHWVPFLIMAEKEGFEPSIRD